MPIVSKQLINLGQQADGTFRVREEHTDTLSVVWRFQYRAPSLAEATEIMNARDLTPQLRDRDFQDLCDFVLQGSSNTVEAFEYTAPLRDITEQDGEEEITVHFASMDGSDAMPLAWWLESLNPPSWTAIYQRIGYASGDASQIQDRAIDLLAAEPRFNLVFDDPR